MFVRFFRVGAWCLGLLFLGGVSWSTFAKPPEKKATSPAMGILKVEIVGLRSNKGRVSITLYNSAKGYPMRPQRAVAQQNKKLQKRGVTFIFPSLPYGTYATAAYHDENGNGKLDTNWIGIPREGTAASNNAKGFMGPPKFRDASFLLARKSLTISMKMMY